MDYPSIGVVSDGLHLYFNVSIVFSVVVLYSPYVLGRSSHVGGGGVKLFPWKSVVTVGLLPLGLGRGFHWLTGG